MKKRLFILISIYWLSLIYIKIQNEKGKLHDKYQFTFFVPEYINLVD